MVAACPVTAGVTLRRFMKIMMEMLGNFVLADDGSDLEELLSAVVGADDVDDDDDDSHGSGFMGGSDHGEDGRRRRHRGHRPRGHVEDLDVVAAGGGLGRPPPHALDGGRVALRHRKRVASPTPPRELEVEIDEHLPLAIADVSRVHRLECQECAIVCMQCL